jgi:hypothetical protein
MSAEADVRDVIARIDAAWRLKRFEGLEDCFHENAIIAGPGYLEYARGSDKCAESYRDFANNAAMLSYAESDQALRVWESTAVYTFAWEMTYQRDEGAAREAGTDQLVFQRCPAGWQMVWRFIHFAPAA